MIELTKEIFIKEVEENEGVTVIDFWAEWCGPCMMLAPVMDEIEKEIPQAKFCKVNVDSQRDLAMLFKVESIPMIAMIQKV